MNIIKIAICFSNQSVSIYVTSLYIDHSLHCSAEQENIPPDLRCNVFFFRSMLYIKKKTAVEMKLLFQVQNEHHDFDPWFI